MDAMNRRIISKVGKRQRPEIDMMEYMQTEETIEFDLDKHVEPIKKKSISEYVDLENEHNDQLVDIIENNEV